VQQKAGIVKPTSQLNGININDDPKLEYAANNPLNTFNYNLDKLNIINQAIPTQRITQCRACVSVRSLDGSNMSRNDVSLEDLDDKQMVFLKQRRLTDGFSVIPD